MGVVESYPGLPTWLIGIDYSAFGSGKKIELPFGAGVASPETGNSQGTATGGINIHHPAITLPRASFVYRVYAGGLVAFTNTSLNNPTIFLWNFGDGKTSAAKNPFHLYTSAGTKTITLTVQNSGGTNSFSQSINITILAEYADFSYIKSGLKVFFIDTSTTLGTFLWTFGDGSTSTEQNPAHTYTVAGDYTVTLLVNGIYEKEEVISVAALIPIQVTDTFTDTNGTPIDEHIPDMPGINPWQMTWGDKPEIQNNKCQVIAAEVLKSGEFYLDLSGIFQYIEADYSMAGYNDEIQLYLSFTDGTHQGYCVDIWRGNTMTFIQLLHDNELLTYVEDSGDPGKYLDGHIKLEVVGNQVTIYHDEVSVISLSHEAVTTGKQKINLTARPTHTVWIDNLNALGSQESSSDVFQPIASFTTDVNSGIAPLTVNFTDTSTGTPTSWLWEWGDGTANGTTQNPSHIFTTAGTYTVKLTATNAYGTSSYVKTIIVNEVQIELDTLPPIASFTADAKIVVPGTTVNFTDTSTGGTATIWSWKANGVEFATTQNASHLFTDAGIYIITFTATDAGGLSSTTMQTIVVTSDIDPSDNIPLAQITPDKTSGFAPTTINLSATVSTPDIFYLWDFGDGSTSPSASVSHTYMKGGIYTVTLTVSNIYGSTVTTMTIVMADVRYADLSIVGYYIIDRVNHRILIYGKTGTLLSSFGGKGSQVGKFNMPTCLLVNRG